MSEPFLVSSVIFFKASFYKNDLPRRRGRRKVMMSIMISLRWSMTGQAPQIVRILSACLLLPPVPINWGPVPVLRRKRDK